MDQWVAAEEACSCWEETLFLGVQRAASVPRHTLECRAWRLGEGSGGVLSLGQLKWLSSLWASPAWRPARLSEAQHVLSHQLPEISVFPKQAASDPPHYFWHVGNALTAAPLAHGQRFDAGEMNTLQICLRPHRLTFLLAASPSSHLENPKPTLLQMADDLERLEHLNATVEAGMQAFYDETEATEGVAFAQPEAGINAISASAEAAEAAQVDACTHGTDLSKMMLPSKPADLASCLSIVVLAAITATTQLHRRHGSQIMAAMLP